MTIIGLVSVTGNAVIAGIYNHFFHYLSHSPFTLGKHLSWLLFFIWSDDSNLHSVSSPSWIGLFVAFH